MKNFILGIDIGTTGAKAAIYDLSGSCIAWGYGEYPMLHPQPGWSELDPNLWWDITINNLRHCFENPKIDASSIAAIGISCTNALLLVDHTGKPLCNAIGHRDTRADMQVQWLKEHIGENRILSICANRLGKGSFGLPTLRWLADNQPEMIKQAEKFLYPSGFIIHKLTGKFSINRPRIGLTLLSNADTGEWSSEILRLSGIPERLLPSIYDSCDVVGEVTEEAARMTGLCAGTPVVAGGIDTVVAAAAAGAVNPGDVAIILGSSGRICAVSEKVVRDRRVLTSHASFPGTWMLMQSTDCAGVSLRWFRDVFGEKARLDAQKKGKSIYQVMDEYAAAVPAGAGNMLYLPYLAGEKSPIWNQNAKGVFFNISLSSDYGYFIRSIFEGVAYSIRDCYEVLRQIGVVSEGVITISGGLTNSTIWCQIFADVLQVPLLLLPNKETETLGGAMIAAYGVGLPGVTKEFGKNIAQRGKLIEPSTRLASLYTDGFLRYKSLYEQVKDCFI
ncbi:MAG TPA: FGGY family carbohydrate kinase [Bacillota bacterium]|jgi:xylulokinase|nr:FGGY family carbohydrate kinase [Bacillota bacterium]